MSQTEPGLWISDPEAYRIRLLELVANRDPIEVMSQTAEALEHVVQTHTAEQMRSRPFPGKWTPTEVIGHLIDAEWVYGYRLRLVLSEDAPTILGMDQDRWVVAQNYNDRPPQELVAEFRAMRQINLALWKQVRTEQHARVGRHNERGDESLGEMLRMLPGHDLWHLEQIKRYLAVVQTA